MRLLKNKRGFFSLLSFFLLAFTVVAGGYFVTGNRSFDDRGEAGDITFQNIFGGMYSQNVNKSCRYPNVLTGACSCPTDFIARRIFDFVVPGVAEYHYYYCVSNEVITPLDSNKHLFGGMYSENSDGTCRYRNHFGNSCSCPVGFAKVKSLEFGNPKCQDRYYSDNVRTTNCGFHQYSCVSENITNLIKEENLFGGIYTKNKDESCRYSNKFTGSCSCPTGFKGTLAHNFDSSNCRWYGDNGTRKTCGVLQYYCTPVAVTSASPQCGTYNEQLFSLAQDVWPVEGTFCVKGTSEPLSPSFPAPGMVTTWTCNKDGKIASCSAGRDIDAKCNSSADCRKSIPYEACVAGACLRGDINNDGVINISDFIEFKKDFISYKENGWSSALARSDLDEDQRISISDYSVFVQSYRAARGIQ